MKRTCLFAIAAAMVLSLSGECFGQATSAVGTSAPARSPADLNREYQQLQRQLLQQFKDKNYEEAARTCRRVIELAPARSDGHYNLACALARLGKKDEALAALAEAARMGLVNSAHMEEDEDLATLRGEKKFAELLNQVRDNEKKEFDGKPIPGLKTVTGLPKGGLRYRLRVDANATGERRNRLIVWLHPSGGSMNNVVEEMAPMLARRGYALLVFTQKNFMGWGDEDAAAMDKTLEAVGRIAGIDANRPVLMGFSAGGQMGLTLWGRKPGRWGGLVLDAAYPTDMEAYVQGRVQAMTLPKDEAVRKVPIFAVVGQKDGGLAMWKKVQKPWLDAGVPLTLVEVPDKAHTWLFGREQRELLDGWLGEVAAGKLPGQPASQPASAPGSGPASRTASRPTTAQIPMVHFQCEKCGFVFEKRPSDLPVSHPGEEIANMRLDCPKCGSKKSCAPIAGDGSSR